MPITGSGTPPTPLQWDLSLSQFAGGGGGGGGTMPGCAAVPPSPIAPELVSMLSAVHWTCAFGVIAGCGALWATAAVEVKTIDAATAAAAIFDPMTCMRTTPCLPTSYSKHPTKSDVAP